MENVKMEYFIDSQDELSKNTKKLLNSLCEDNQNIKNLYKNILNELEKDRYSIRESRRILKTLQYSLEIIKENEQKNLNIRKDSFLHIENGILLAEELIEGILISAINEHEENKLKYYGYLLGNILFKEDLDRDECNRLIKISRKLSYCQIKLINLYVISQTIQVPILKREDYTKTGISNYKLLGILQDTLDMIQKSILNGSGKLVLDIVQINPSKIKVQGIGSLLYNLMSLNKMPYDEMEDLLDILSKKN